MQCWNCGFENIPGLKACARCASTLNLEAVEVEPPRASRWRTATRLSRVGNRMGTNVEGAWTSIRGWIPRLDHTEVHPFALVLSVIPGLGHFRIGRRRLGGLLLAVWLTFLLLFILSIGTAWDWLLLGGLVGTHATTIFTLFAAPLGYERPSRRLAFGLCAALGLWLLIYAPTGWLATRFCRLIPITANWRDDAIIARGDVLVTRGPWLKPSAFARGDLVAYEIRVVQGGGFLLHEGLGIDRIVGIPGDHVQISSGELLVNGLAPPPHEQPLGGVPHWVNVEVNLSERQYIILPSRLHLNLGGAGAPSPPPEVIHMLTLASRDSIGGKIVFRLRPLARFGNIR